RLDADHGYGQPCRLQCRPERCDKHAPAGQFPVLVRGGVHPAAGGAVHTYDAQHGKSVLLVLPNLPNHLIRQLPQPGRCLRLAHGPADAGVLCLHWSFPSFGISPVQPQTAQLRARHLSHAYLSIQNQPQNLPVGGRHLRRA
ncbi:Sigma-70, region 4, partial [Dysosmobacter welbionis]